ncbi:MAG: hypothetical protein K2Q25_06760 [Mycobacteriaceae bacterium]|nr:hypothetical protein [Mycobacteriaceae bacterium]
MPDSTAEPSGGRIFSGYGIASAVLGVVSVVALVFGANLWWAHHRQLDERAYLSRVMQTALDWTGVLINMNTDNIDASLQKLHTATVGQLNIDFESTVQPYRQVVQRLQSHSTGRVEAVAIETLHHDLDAASGAHPSTPPPAPPSPAPTFATRTDTVLVVATSVSENVGGKPQTVHWNLRLKVSDVDGTPMICGLESIR